MSLQFTESPTFVDLTEYNDVCTYMQEMRSDALGDIYRSGWGQLSSQKDLDALNGAEIEAFNDAIHNESSTQWLDTSKIYIDCLNIRSPESIRLALFLHAYIAVNTGGLNIIPAISELLYFRIPNSYIYYFYNIDRIICCDVQGHGGAPNRLVNDFPTVYYNCKCLSMDACNTFANLIHIVNRHSIYIQESSILRNLMYNSDFD